MSEIKNYRPRRSIKAFQFTGPDSLPDGWKSEDACFMGWYIVSPDGFYVMAEKGSWIVFEDGAWCGMYDADFRASFEECES